MGLGAVMCQSELCACSDEHSVFIEAGKFLITWLHTGVLIVLSPTRLKKTNERLPFFVIAAAETWLDGQPSEFFLSGLQKLEFGRCSLFPSWSG